MNRFTLKLIAGLLAGTWLVGISGCAAPNQPPQTMDDWMALDQVNP